jgi:hypothetical protein
MRKMLLVLSVLLLGLTWAIAQDTTTQSSPSAGSQSSAGSSDSSATAAGSGQATQSGASGQMTVEGCLSGTSGNFTLSDKNGTTYQLTGDTAKLSEHVGHEVKVTGMSSSGSSAGGGDNAKTGASASGGGQTLQVSSVKHVSKTCQGAGGMSH